MRKLLGKYIFITTSLSWPEGGIYKVLRRINRETKTQYISDTQRLMFLNEEGKNNWDKKPIFHRTSRRYRKNKLINEDGSL